MKEQKRKFDFIIYRKGADSSDLLIQDIINIKKGLTEEEATNCMNHFINNGYCQMAECKIVEVK